MTQIALFHSVLGVRPGILDAAERLRSQGHDVRVVDQYDGRSFEDYREADEFAQGIGYPALMASALAAVENLPDGFLCVGFSNGGGMSEFVACHRPVGGVVLCSGTLPLAMLGAEAWPAGVPAQIHYMLDDPFKHEGWAEAVADSVRAAEGAVEAFDYVGSGHLFTDESRPDEYDEAAAELLWQRVFAFCNRANSD